MAQRLDKGSSFLRALHEHSRLLSIISAEEGSRVSREKFDALIGTLYDTSSKSGDSLYEFLTDMKPEPILFFDYPFIHIQKHVADLFNWLTNRLGMKSHHSIEGLLGEITDACLKIQNALEEGSPHYRMILTDAINRIEYRSQELIVIGENNLNSVSRALLEFKESELSSEERSFLASEILDDFINPMNDLIEPGGQVDDTLEKVRVQLNLVESTPALQVEIRDSASRLIRIQMSVRARLLDAQRVALRSLIPELELHIHQASSLEKNCATALRLFNTYSARYLAPVREFNLFKEVRRFNLIPEAAISEYSFRESRVDNKRQIDLSAVTHFTQPLDVEDITQNIVESYPDDILQAVLSAFPEESLNECSRITTDYLIKRRFTSAINFFGMKKYTHNGQVLEVNRFGVR